MLEHRRAQMELSSARRNAAWSKPWRSFERCCTFFLQREQAASFLIAGGERKLKAVPFELGWRGSGELFAA
jgi:hypothetical protein